VNADPPVRLVVDVITGQTRTEPLTDAERADLADLHAHSHRQAQIETDQVAARRELVELAGTDRLAGLLVRALRWGPG
jgi:hypothetical protein